ncbi:hypothetical protein EVAR_80391_1 [Eumeta japonica]|uniref:Uncharacterized protein n=1 Tax=Eumeta variegata TaxID=151549 RepID=A0A4C1VHP2_EUMVA|nr:hypothetical protein EVAR_80391_1 [Eumeta japonica]
MVIVDIHTSRTEIILESFPQRRPGAPRAAGRTAMQKKSHAQDLNTGSAIHSQFSGREAKSANADMTSGHDTSLDTWRIIGGGRAMTNYVNRRRTAAGLLALTWYYVHNDTELNPCAATTKPSNVTLGRPCEHVGVNGHRLRVSLRCV